jgi:sugar phosphate isomerase/epimerase
MIARRQFLGATLAAALPAAPPERYKLGCMAQMFRGLPLDEAIARVRRAGYRYIVPSRTHAGEPTFTPELPKSARPAMVRRLKDLGVEPIASLNGFGNDPHRAFEQYIAQIDLCADFAIPVLIGGGPWYFQKFPAVPKRAADWDKEVSDFYAALEKAVRHAESAGVTITLKPHTGITATAKACMEVVRRVVSPRLRICWDAGNVSFYEGIFPDPDLPELAPHVSAVCIKDHRGGRAEANFPVPGQGQIDHEAMFRTLFAKGFHGPLAVERVDGTDNMAKLAPDVVEQRLTAAYRYLARLLERV